MPAQGLIRGDDCFPDFFLEFRNDTGSSHLRARHQYCINLGAPDRLPNTSADACTPDKAGVIAKGGNHRHPNTSSLQSGYHIFGNISYDSV
ncbi:hypothetical protein GOC33_31490 [Sinorhizobium meliloti]|nr:hypothetical protein [Sinorhizobium meliloti]